MRKFPFVLAAVLLSQHAAYSDAFSQVVYGIFLYTCIFGKQTIVCLHAQLLKDRKCHPFCILMRRFTYTHTERHEHIHLCMHPAIHEVKFVKIFPLSSSSLSSPPFLLPLLPSPLPPLHPRTPAKRRLLILTQLFSTSHEARCRRNVHCFFLHVCSVCVLVNVRRCVCVCVQMLPMYIRTSFSPTCTRSLKEKNTTHSYV